MSAEVNWQQHKKQQKANSKLFTAEILGKNFS